MKILSNTDTNGRVVEFSEQEFKELYLLAKSCNPEITDSREVAWNLQQLRNGADLYYDMDGFDFTEPLANVRAFREAQFNINKIRTLIDGIEKAIKK